MAKSHLLCTGCKEYYPRETMHKLPKGNFHDIECATLHGKAKAEKARKAKKAKDQQDRERVLGMSKKDLETKPELTKKAQKAFNAFIRYRDRIYNCISCGCSEGDIKIRDRMFGVWDCGHFLSVGARPELRFEELNANKECKPCNGGAGNFAHKDKTVHKQYEENLIKKIGQEKVDWLNGPHELPNYTHDDLREIAKHYRGKLRELKNG